MLGWLELQLELDAFMEVTFVCLCISVALGVNPGAAQPRRGKMRCLRGDEIPCTWRGIWEFAGGAGRVRGGGVAGEVGIPFLNPLLHSCLQTACR